MSYMDKYVSCTGQFLQGSYICRNVSGLLIVYAFNGPFCRTRVHLHVFKGPIVQNTTCTLIPYEYISHVYMYD